MAFNLNLTVAEYDAVIRFLLSSHRVNFRVQMMDLDHHYVSDITPAMLGGQVSVNIDGDDATRSLELALFDPNYDLGFDTADFIDGVWFFDRMVQVIVWFYVPEIGKFIEVPLFTGPVRGYKRKRSIVTLKCVGKDVFAKAAWTRQIVKKGTNQIDSIRSVLEALGETKFRFEATSNATIKKDKVVDRSAIQSPWGWCRSTATGLGLRLYYDGEGYAVLRKKPIDRPVFAFSDGDGGSVLSEPDSEGDYSRLANVVLAQGPAIGSGAAPKGIAEVDSSSPLSPTKLRRGGKPLYFGVVVLRDSIVSQKSADSVAQTELEDRQNAAYGVGFDSLPFWMLEEFDPIRIDVAGLKTVAPAGTFAFGLSPSAVMPVGYKKLVSPVLARIRRF